MPVNLEEWRTVDSIEQDAINLLKIAGEWEGDDQ